MCLRLHSWPVVKSGYLVFHPQTSGHRPSAIFESWQTPYPTSKRFCFCGILQVSSWWFQTNDFGLGIGEQKPSLYTIERLDRKEMSCFFCKDTPVSFKAFCAYPAFKGWPPRVGLRLCGFAIACTVSPAQKLVSALSCFLQLINMEIILYWHMCVSYIILCIYAILFLVF